MVVFGADPVAVTVVVLLGAGPDATGGFLGSVVFTTLDLVHLFATDRKVGPGRRRSLILHVPDHSWDARIVFSSGMIVTASLGETSAVPMTTTRSPGVTPDFAGT